MSEFSMSDEQERLIEAALSAGRVTREQVEEARTIQKTVAGIGIDQSLAGILVKKGHLSVQQVRALQREISERRIGKYEILEKIGVGGAGVVYRARHVTLGRVVALKVLSNRRASDQKYLESFVREARIAVTLNHKNIVRGLDYGESGGYHYFVMEFVPGDTLYELVQREGRLEENRALEIGVQVGRALEHALQYDLSHRDLKPDNILISVETSEAKLCDLGLAKPKKLETAGARSHGSAIGTPAYIAPEQIRGIDEADMRSDIYSLGATLFHAVCGRPPFEGDSVEELLRKHLNEEPPDPREIVVDLSSGTAAVLLKMLAKKPDDRYQRLADLIADLEAVRDGRPPVHTITFARKGPAVGEGRSRADLARQRSRPWRLLVVLAVVAIGAASLFLILGRTGDGGPSGRPEAKGTTEEPRRDDRPVVVVDREGEARKALVAARDFREVKPGQWESAAARFRFVIEKYGDTRFAIDAREGLASILDAWNLRAGEVWRELAADVDGHADRGEFGAALRVVDAFPGELRIAEGYEAKVEACRKGVLKAARDAWAKASADAQAAVRDLRFDDALAAIEPLEACGLAEIEREAKAAREKLTAERERVDGLRRQGEEAFRTLYGTVLLAFGSDGYDTAFKLLEKARESDVYLYAQDALEEAGLDLNRLAAFHEEIRRGFERKKGRTVTLAMADGRSQSVRIENSGGDALRVRRGRSSTRVPWSDISVESRVEAGLEALGAMKPASRLDAALWVLAQGRLDLLARQIEAAASLGGEVRPYETRALNVRVVRDARVEEALREANVHILDGRLEDARGVLDRTVAFAPDHAGARFRRGLVLSKLRRHEAALADLTAAVRLGETDARLHLEIARIHEEEERLSEALAAYDAFLRTSPEGPEAEEAVRRAGEIRGRLNADRAKQLRTQGEAAMRKRAWKVALEGLREADRLIPDDPKTVLNIAKSSHRLGLIFEAYVTYRRYLELRPRGSGPRDARKAIASLEAAYTNPKEAVGDLASGEQAYQSGKYDEAIDRLDLGLEKAPLSAIGYFNRAWSWYLKSLISGAGSHTRSAIADFDRLMLLEPGSGRALAGRALCWHQLRRHETALDDARKAIGLLPDDYLSYNTAALACAALERYRDALDHYDKAIRLAPKLATLYISRARARWTLNMLEEALGDLDRASRLEVEPDQVGEIRDLRKRITRQKEEGGG